MYVTFVTFGKSAKFLKLLLMNKLYRNPSVITKEINYRHIRVSITNTAVVIIKILNYIGN